MITVNVLEGGRTYSLGENTLEAVRQGGIATLAANSATAAGRYFVSQAAGEAGSTTGQFFSHPDGAGGLVYRERTGGGSTIIGYAATKAQVDAKVAIAELAASGASQGAEMVGYRGRNTKAKLDDWRTPLDMGISNVGVGNTTQDTLALDAVAATGKHLVVPFGLNLISDTSLGHRPVAHRQIFEINGNITYSGTQHVLGGGHANGFHGLIFIDQWEGISVIGRGVLNGARASAVAGNNGRAVYALRAPGLLVDGPRLEEFIGEGLKLVNCPNMDVRHSTHFYRTRNIGAEIKSYAANPYTGLAWVGTVEGPSGRIDGIFEYIDDGLHGAGNGCGVLLASESGAVRPRDVTISGSYLDCLLAIWSENNFPGSEAQDIRVIEACIRGNIRGAATVECSDGLGLVGIRGLTVRDVTARDQCNIVPPGGAETVGLNLVDCEDALVENFRCFNDAAITNKMQHAIKVYGSDRVTIEGGTQTNVTSTPVLKVATNSDLAIERFYGGVADEDWGEITHYVFSLQNVPNSATTNLLALGEAEIDKYLFDEPGRVVGLGVRCSAATTGSFTISALVGAVAQTPLNITQALMAGGADYLKERSAASAPQYAQGSRLEVTVTTDGTGLPNTNDIEVTVIVDHSYKDII